MSKQREEDNNRDKYLDANLPDKGAYLSAFGTSQYNQATTWKITELTGAFKMVRIESKDQPGKYLSVDEDGKIALSVHESSCWFVKDNNCDADCVRFQWWRCLADKDSYLDANVEGKPLHASRNDGSYRKFTQWRVVEVTK